MLNSPTPTFLWHCICFKGKSEWILSLGASSTVEHSTELELFAQAVTWCRLSLHPFGCAFGLFQHKGEGTLFHNGAAWGTFLEVLEFAPQRPHSPHCPARRRPRPPPSSRPPPPRRGCRRGARRPRPKTPKTERSERWRRSASERRKAGHGLPRP